MKRGALIITHETEIILSREIKNWQEARDIAFQGHINNVTGADLTIILKVYSYIFNIIEQLFIAN